jgi:YD repeat-containing protein
MVPGPATADLVYSYNANGLLINRLTRTGTGASTNGFNTVFRYNPVGSLTNVDYPAGTDLQFEYDALQRRTKMVDAIGTTTYTYTVGSGMSLIAEDGPWASDTLTVTNRLGRRLGLHLQQPSGPTWSQIQQTLITRTNSFVTAWNSSVNLTYDAASQVLGAWTTNSAGAVVTGECRGYLYDAAGNLATRTNNATGGTTTASVNALNQLTSGLGYTGFTHDRRGNLTFATGGTSMQFEYNYEDQCTSAGYYVYGTKSEYTYDGLGRLRIRKDYSWTGSSWYPGTEIRYVWDGWLLVQERNSGTLPWCPTPAATT